MVELHEKVVEVRVSDNVIAIVMAFEQDVLRMIWGYAPQSGNAEDT